MNGVIALLGSGETAPGMTKVHRGLLARHDAVRAINLEGPYGFQANVAQVSGKLVTYFATSLHTTLTSLALDIENASEEAREKYKREIRRATYVFAGPGSPSYALRQWRPLNLASDLRAALARGATVSFASAAALTLGSHSAPIYEIYKVGDSPVWLEGLDLFGDLGLNCAVIPHYDNAEGRNYDTRYCYLGEERLIQLERQLPDDVAILGVDEHTALLFDLAADTVSVTGRSAGHWRHRGVTLDLANGSTTRLAELRATSGAAWAPPEPEPLALEKFDTEDIAEPPQTVLAPVIDGVLSLRRRAKENGDFPLADELRQILTSAGIALHDQATTTTWEIS